MPTRFNTIRPLTKNPPEKFHHKELFLAINSAMNVVPVDLNTNNPKELQSGEIMQERNDASVMIECASAAFGIRQLTDKITFKQIDSDFNLAKFWSKPSDSLEYYNPAVRALNLAAVEPIETIVEVHVGQFTEALALLENKIRAKKTQQQNFNDLFFAELYLAALELGALIKSQRTVFFDGKNPTSIFPVEMNLITDIVRLINATLNNPHDLQLLSLAQNINTQILNYIEYNKKHNPIIATSEKFEFSRNLVSIATKVCVIVAALTFGASIVCLAGACPPAGIFLGICAIALAASGLILGVTGLYVEKKYGEKAEELKEMATRACERQSAIGRFFVDASKLIDKDLPTVTSNPSLAP